jgi:hypothetical protein
MRIATWFFIPRAMAKISGRNHTRPINKPTKTSVKISILNSSHCTINITTFMEISKEYVVYFMSYHTTIFYCMDSTCAEITVLFTLSTTIMTIATLAPEVLGRVV